MIQDSVCESPYEIVIFQRDFVPTFPNSEATYNLSENFSNIIEQTFVQLYPGINRSSLIKEAIKNNF